MAAAKRLLCIPVELQPRQRLGLTRCEVIAGVTLSKLSDSLRRTLDRLLQKLPKNVPQFYADYVILVDIDKYTDGVRRRIGKEGHIAPPVPRPFDDWPIIPDDLVRHVLMSLILLQRFRFVVGGSYHLEIERTGYRVTSYAPTPAQEASYASLRAIPVSSRPVVNRDSLRRIAFLLDPYYRTGLWQGDRMAVALSSLWAGICTPFLHHTFLSLTIVLEALLGDEGPEIAHKLAERAAVLISRTRAQRPSEYRVVKDLYNIRSRVVHGSARTKKGVITWDSFHISAKKAIVPVTKLDELGRVVNQVIHAVLSRPELLAIIQKLQPEEKTSRDLDDFFLRLTLT